MALLPLSPAGSGFVEDRHKLVACQKATMGWHGPSFQPDCREERSP